MPFIFIITERGKVSSMPCSDALSFRRKPLLFVRVCAFEKGSDDMSSFNGLEEKFAECSRKFSKQFTIEINESNGNDNWDDFIKSSGLCSCMETVVNGWNHITRLFSATAATYNKGSLRCSGYTVAEYLFNWKWRLKSNLLDPVVIWCTISHRRWPNKLEFIKYCFRSIENINFQAYFVKDKGKQSAPDSEKKPFRPRSCQHSEDESK